MKKLVTTPKKIEKVVEVVTEHLTEIVDSDGGPVTLLGKEVYVACTSYAYSGKLVGVNDKFIELEEPYLVYDTGNWNNKKWQDAQRLPTSKCCLFMAQIENIFAVER